MTASALCGWQDGRKSMREEEFRGRFHKATHENDKYYLDESAILREKRRDMRKTGARGVA